MNVKRLGGLWLLTALSTSFTVASAHAVDARVSEAGPEGVSLVPVRLSAGSGQVVAVVDDQPDQEVGSMDPDRPGGNYVVIRYGPQLYGVYAHMMLGWAVVAVGDSVEAGSVIGRVGNSGNTSEPHLHFHLVDRWEGLDPVLSIFTSQGLPASFWNAHVRRGNQTFPLEGAIPLELDLVEP